MSPAEKLINEIDIRGLWSKTLALGRNEFLKNDGSKDSNVYLVVTGSLRIFVMDEVEEHTIRFGYQNNIVAALDSFITGQPSDLCIQALKRTELKSIDKKAFMDFVLSSRERTALWHDILGQLICQQMDRERDLLTSSPVERYRRVLQRSPQLFREIPNKYIASYLRMTPETLSRIKKS